MDELNFSQVDELLNYDLATGLLLWKTRSPLLFSLDGKQDREKTAKTWNSRYAMQPAFTASMSNGYRCGNIFSRTYLAHRIAWMLSFKEWPDHEIDHVNGDRGDNRLVNLRDVSHPENGKNLSISKANTSGITGISFASRENMWRAYIRANGENFNLGYYHSKTDAIAARKAAEIKFEFHANHGKR